MTTKPTDNWRSRITTDPSICGGQPCITGTRVPVSIIVATAADEGREAVLTHFPHLTIEDVDAAMKFATDASRG